MQQRLGNPGDHSIGLAPQLAPGDADRPVSGGNKALIALTVALERDATGVERVPVHLHDEALIRPQKVGDVSGPEVVPSSSDVRSRLAPAPPPAAAPG
jgi:hypothetical protein